MIINTLVCVLIALDADVMEAYVIMGLVWIGVMILCMIIWVTGSAFSNISKLNKRMAQLEQKLDNLLLAQVAGYRTANVPTVNTEVPAANTIPAQAAEEAEHLIKGKNKTDNNRLSNKVWNQRIQPRVQGREALAVSRGLWGS